MKKKDSFTADPTKAELDILRILWEYGPSTVRLVNEELNKQKEVQYTSTLKQMQVMTEKGLLKRDESNMKHVYSPGQAEEKVKEYLLQKFINSFYKGSPGKLIMQLLGNKKTSRKDIEYIKEQLKKLDEK
jgi:BlaI family penicillinase repressor